MKMPDDYYDHTRAEALDLLASCPRKVLDIGCGRGGVSREIRRRCLEAVVYGCDVHRDPNFDYDTVFAGFSQVNLETDRIPFEIGDFDLILLLDVLEHLSRPQEVLEQLVVQARPGCQFLVSLPNFHYYSNLAAIIRSGRFAYTDDGILDRTHLRFFGFEDAKALLSGLLQIERTLQFNPFENAKSRLIGRVFGPRYSAYQNIFLCRKAPSAG